MPETLHATAKPIEVEALQFTDYESGEVIVGWLGEAMPNIPMPAQVQYANDLPYSIMVQTPNGLVVLYLNDWLIREPDGNFRPVPETVWNTQFEVSDG